MGINPPPPFQICLLNNITGIWNFYILTKVILKVAAVLKFKHEGCLLCKWNIHEWNSNVNNIVMIIHVYRLQFVYLLFRLTVYKNPFTFQRTMDIFCAKFYFMSSFTYKEVLFLPCFLCYLLLHWWLQFINFTINCCTMLHYVYCIHSMSVVVYNSIFTMVSFFLRWTLLNFFS